MEADSTSDRIPVDAPETASQEVFETMETTLPSNGCEERSLSEVPRRDQHDFGGSHGSSSVLESNADIDNPVSHMDNNQHAIKDTAVDSECDLSFSQASNDADLSSVKELVGGGCNSITISTGVSVSKPYCQSEEAGFKMAEKSQVAKDFKAMKESQTAESVKAMDCFKKMDSSISAECPQAGSQSTKGLPSTESLQAPEGTCASEGYQGTAGQQVQLGFLETERSQAKECSQASRASQVNTKDSQAIEVPQDMECSQAPVDDFIEALQARGDSKGESLATLGVQVPVPVGSDSTNISTPKLLVGMPDWEKMVQDTASCSDFKTGVKTLGKTTNEDDDLYSEIIATTTKVKILKKYFGDTRRTGLCHRPHHKRFYGSFKCKKCRLSFGYLPSLLFHGSKHGKKYHVFKCSKCNYKSPAPGAFTKHELSCHSNQLFQCRICNATFLQKSTLCRHKEANHLNYFCKLCNCLFLSHCSLTEHLKVQHVIHTDRSFSRMESFGKSDTSFQQKFYRVVPRSSTKCSRRCVKCKALFPKQSDAFVQHQQEYKVSIQAACLWCGYKGTSACDLSCHQRQVHHWCLVCNWKLGSHELLDQHTKFVHHDFEQKEGYDEEVKSPKILREMPHVLCQKEYRCPHCGKKLTSTVRLQQHIKENHDGNRPLVVQHWYCTTCNVIFPTKRLLELHIRLNHRPMQKAETSPLVRAEPTKEDQEWRCLLCSTLHHTLEECNRHLIVYHPDEYEYCSRKEIAEPSLPLPVSALSDTGPPYTCNMCDSKVSSVAELHTHKEQFHKIAYSISINDERHSKRTIYRCRYKCGFANSIRKHVLKHEPTCRHNTKIKQNILRHPPIVMNSNSGEMVHDQVSAATVTDPAFSQKSKKLEVDHPKVKEATGSEEDFPADSINQVESMEAPSEKKDVDQTAVHGQEERVNPASCSLEPVLPQHMSTISSGPSKPSQPSTSEFVSAFAVSKTISQSSFKHPQSSKLSVYGKHDVITSSSDDDSNCSWLDKSSDSERSDEATLTGGSSPLSSEREDGDTESLQHAPTLCPQSQSSELGGQTAQSKPTTPSSNPCLSLLQPTVLMRFFQAIDLSDLYRLALQMITGSPQPHSLPTSDSWMVSSKVAKFKYKIPLGYSHPEFKEIPLFPSSKEAKVLDNMQTLPSSLISKHYKGVLAKPFHNYLSSLVDSAVINNFSEITIKGIERYVKKQRVDDRKDITSSLSRYIVSQYVKNQQKKPPATQPISSSISASNNPVMQPIFRSVSTANSPGAGPSGAQSRPSGIHLVLRKSAVPVATIKYMGIQPSAVCASGASVQANLVVRGPLPLTKALINKSSSKVSAETTFKSGVTCTSVATPVSQTKPSNKTANRKNTQSPKGKKRKRVPPNLKVSKSPASTKPTNKKPEVYSTPVRRSQRLRKSVGDLQSSSGLNDLEKCHTTPERNTQPKGKKSGTSKTRMDNCTSDHEQEETHKDRKETKHHNKPTYRVKCKESQAEITEDTTDHGNPKSRPFEPILLPQSGFTGIAVTPRNEPPADSQIQQVSNSGVLNNHYNLMLQMVPGTGLQIISLNTKLQQGSILADTIDRDGVIQTRVTRHPLHGLNFTTVPRLIAPNNGAFHFTRPAVPLNRTRFFTQPISVNSQKKGLPGQFTILPGLSLKAPVVQVNPQSLGSRNLGALIDPVLYPDANKNVKYVTNKHGVSPNCPTSPGFSLLKNMEQLTSQRTLGAGNWHNSTSKWKKTLTKDDVLASMVRRKLQRYTPYKLILNESLKQTDGSTEMNSKDQLQASSIDKMDSNSTVDTSERRIKQPFCLQPISTPQEKVSNDCFSEQALPDQSLCAPPMAGDPKILAAGTSSSSSQTNLPSISTAGVEGDKKLQSITEQVVDTTKEEDKTSTGSEELPKDESCSDSTSKRNSEITNIENAEETNTCITRRSLRRRDLKRKEELGTKLNNKKQKTTVDHSYIKKPRLYSSDKIRKLKALRQCRKRFKMPRDAKMKSNGSKTSADRRLVPHDHSYTGSRPRRSSPRLKATAKMDHSYFWKTQDGMRASEGSNAGSCRQDSAVRIGKVLPEINRKLPRVKDLRDSAEDHVSSRDHSYSTSFPKQVQDQISAMDHCYVKLTPISISSERQVPQATTMPSSLRETFQAEIEAAEEKSNSPDAAVRVADTGSSRRTRRSSDQSHTM